MYDSEKNLWLVVTSTGDKYAVHPQNLVHRLLNKQELEKTERALELCSSSDEDREELEDVLNFQETLRRKPRPGRMIHVDDDDQKMNGNGVGRRLMRALKL